MSFSRIASLPEYHAALPAKLVVPENVKQTVVLDTLNTSVIQVKSEASLTITGLFEKGWQERQTLTIQLTGEHASVNLAFFILGSDAEAFPFDLRIIQSAQSTKVGSTLRSVLTGRAILDATGTLVIGRKAQKSSAFFSAGTLLRSLDAKAKVIPSLEILTDDIRARHAATIGKLDEGQLFYLQSRGLTYDEASLMLMSAFMAADVQKIPDEAIRQAVFADINAALIESNF
ncbi:MAG: SufD family Fe-S cluster assembly protein [bacterium]|nr:SufD family Fe-S cluster assembly protein [bacterium]